jgi:hypothetical protein
MMSNQQVGECGNRLQSLFEVLHVIRKTKGNLFPDIEKELSRVLRLLIASCESVAFLEVMRIWTNVLMPSIRRCGNARTISTQVTLIQSGMPTIDSAAFRAALETFRGSRVKGGFNVGSVSATPPVTCIAAPGPRISSRCAGIRRELSPRARVAPFKSRKRDHV